MSSRNPHCLFVVCSLLLCMSLTTKILCQPRQDSLKNSKQLEKSHNISLESAEILRDLLADLAEKMPDDYDLSEVTELLTAYLERPIDLNGTTPEVLKGLFFLTPIQITNLFKYLEQQGPLIDLLELQRIDGFDVITVQRLIPFVTISNGRIISGSTPKAIFNRDHHDLIFRYNQVLHHKKGFQNLSGSRYIGTPEKLLLRYRYNLADRLSVGLVMEKDPGEELFNRKSVSDHLSANLAILKTGRLKKFIIGDYSMQIGQGLSLWTGFGYGKGADVTSVAARETGLRPYSSSNESSFLRGVATTVGISKYLDLTTFLSYRKLDASLKVMADGNSTLSNINTSGLHRTSTEVKNRRSLSQTLYGTAITFNNQQLSLGALIYNSLYNHPFTTGTAAYNRFSFMGKKLTNTSLNYQYSFRNYLLYGETAHSFRSGWAFLHGLMISLSSKWSTVILYRKYNKDYHTFFGQAIGEATEVANEAGLYAGVNYTPSRKWIFSLYADYFKFPWLRYRVDSSSFGKEWLAQFAFIPHKKLKMQFRYKLEVKQQNADAGSMYKGLQNVRKQMIRLECNWWLAKQINLQTRTEINNYQKEPLKKEYGFMLCQDLNYKPLSSRLTGNIRLAYFQTSSYNNRMYVYEDDVLYGASSSIYYGKGIRSFLNLRYKLAKHLDLWTRYSIFLYKDQETIGSGLDEIDGNKKSEIKLQFRYRF